jgi:hypothetical protein
MEYFLKFPIPVMGVEKGETFTNAYDYKRLLIAMKVPEEEIPKKMLEAVEYQRQDMMDHHGFTEEESTAKVEERMEIEVNTPPEMKPNEPVEGSE